MDKIIKNNIQDVLERLSSTRFLDEEEQVTGCVIEETKMDVSLVLERGTRIKPYTLEEFQKYGKADIERFVVKMRQEGVKISGIEEINLGMRQKLLPTSRGEMKFSTYLSWYQKVANIATSIKQAEILDHFLLYVCGVDRMKTRDIKVPYALEEFEKYGKQEMHGFVESLRQEGVQVSSIQNINLGDKMIQKFVPTCHRGNVQFNTYLNWYKNAANMKKSAKNAEVLDHFLFHVCGVVRLKTIDVKVPYTLAEFMKHWKKDMRRFVNKLRQDGVKITGIDSISIKNGYKLIRTSRGDVHFKTYLNWYKNVANMKESAKNAEVLDHFLFHVCGVVRLKKVQPYTLEEFQQYRKGDMQSFVIRLQQDGVNIICIEEINMGMGKKLLSTSRGDVQLQTYLNWYKKATGLEGCTHGQVLAHLKITLLSSASQADRRRLVDHPETGDEEYL